ncbi:MAG: NusG domain II-containing protein [Clostridia bacterium]|nr:NusG domain II-containing protein [Clostridia bacterium]
MSLKKIQQVKRGKAFVIWDILIYGVIITVIGAILLAVFLTRDTSPLKGVRISVEDLVVYEYNFESGDEKLNETYVEKSDDGKIKVTSKYGYNVIEINKNGSVKVTDANCGKLDCVYTGELKDNSGIIYCSPHKLKIVPYGFDIDDGNIIM